MMQFLIILRLFLFILSFGFKFTYHAYVNFQMILPN